jgi:hypothetical protein
MIKAQDSHYWLIREDAELGQWNYLVDSLGLIP